ncbi:MAG TPA: patatin-like phospholipase family protein [Albitalea sp.]|uniref:patatin-like phospholipase family protein n=1 Tax=Piscinibacter sp. TaxID=1903157 RepID=UPI002ED241D1
MRVLLLCLALLLGGCSTTRPWTNAPLPASAAPARDPVQSMAAERLSLFGGVALSGGGARAAAFGYGVMLELKATTITWEGRTTTLMDEVDIVSGVSGGSIIAAYYAAFGDATFTRFEREFLRQDFQRSLIYRSLRPDNLPRLGSPWFGRGHVLAQRLDELFEGKTFGDLADHAGPQLKVTATDLSLGMAFEFSPEQFALICSDLSSVPLSFAVAASSAVPMLLAPMTLHNHAGHCPRAMPPLESLVGSHGHQSTLLLQQAQSYLDAERRPYIHLVDGGVADNLGLRRAIDVAAARGGITRGPGELPAHAVRKLFVIAVNSEREPGYRIDLSDRTPSTMQVLDAMLFGSGARATRETLVVLQHTIDQWQREIDSRAGDRDSPFAPDSQVHVIHVSLGDLKEEGLRRLLLHVPTAFTIGDEDVTRLIAAGRQALRDSPEFQALLRSLESPRYASKGSATN